MLAIGYLKFLPNRKVAPYALALLNFDTTVLDLNEILYENTELDVSRSAAIFSASVDSFGLSRRRCRIAHLSTHKM